MIKISTFNEFEILLKEGKNLTIKRKYTKNPVVYEEETVGLRGPVRNKVLSFINEKGKVTKTELKEFFDTLEEELGKKPNFEWIRKNQQYVTKEISESDEIVYSLTKRGNKVLDRMMKYGNSMKEGLEEDYDEEDYEDEDNNE